MCWTLTTRGSDMTASACLTPSPLAGEGWGGGVEPPKPLPPTPTLPRKGGGSRNHARACFALAFSLAAVGCQGNESVAPPTTGWVANTLRLGQGSDFRSLDPAVANDTVSVPIIRVLFQPLLDYDDGVNLVPLTAEAMPTLSKDGKTYTFHLRKDVHFSNGRAVTADDYLYSWRRVMNPKTKSPWASFATDRIAGALDYAEGKATDVKGLRAPDAYTLEVELIHPDLTFPYVAAMPFLAPVPREVIEDASVAKTDWNDHFALHPVGNGPFVFKSWNRGLRMTFERDPNYWGPKPAALDAIDIQFGLDSLTLQMMFERGELDLLDRIPSAAYVRLRNDPRWKPNFEALVFNGVLYLDMNCEMEPFTGPDRQKSASGDQLRRQQGTPRSTRQRPLRGRQGHRPAQHAELSFLGQRLFLRSEESEGTACGGRLFRRPARRVGTLVVQRRRSVFAHVANDPTRPRGGRR